MIATFVADPNQQAILEHPARIKVAVCGRRWGKTILMALALVMSALKNPGSRAWYVANDYSLCMAQMRMMKRSKAFMQFVSHVYSQFPPRFDMKNGSEIAFRSADRPELLRGAGLKLICLDECAAANNGDNLFWTILLPMIADTHGSIIAGSTYNGKNWFYDLAEKGKEWKDGDLIKTWNFPTSTGYSFQGEQGKKDLLELKSVTGPMKWQQEYECIPLAVVDAVFRNVDKCIVAVMPRMEPERGHRYVCSQDIGRIVDKSGVVVMDLDTGEIVFSENYDLGTPHVEQAKRTDQIATFWSGALVCLDTTGGASGGHNESVIEEYSKVLQNFRAITFTLDTKRNMVNQLDMDLENNRISIPRIFTDLISQLKLYRYQYGEKAIQPTFFGRPDDLCCAAMMCSWARKERWGPEIGGRSIRFN